MRLWEPGTFPRCFSWTYCKSWCIKSLIFSAQHLLLKQSETGNLSITDNLYFSKESGTRSVFPPVFFTILSVEKMFIYQRLIGDIEGKLYFSNRVEPGQFFWFFTRFFISLTTVLMTIQLLLNSLYDCQCFYSYTGYFQRQLMEEKNGGFPMYLAGVFRTTYTSKLSGTQISLS